MNSLKIISIISLAIIAFSVLLIIIYLLLKPFKVIKDEEDNLKISYGVWFSSLFIAGSAIIYFMIKSAFEAIDIIERISPKDKIIQMIKVGSGMILVSFGWFVLWCYIVKSLSKWFYKISETKQMDSDNISFFCIKSFMLLGFIFSLLPIFEIILELFIPEIEIPFYH